MNKLIITLIFGVSMNLFGQTPIFTPFKQLPERITTINCIALEGDSILWLGTNSGLVKIVNDTFQIFWDKQDPSKFKINKIVIDSYGTKWLGTYRSSIVKFQNKLDAEEFSFKPLVDNKFQLVTALFTRKSELWIGTSEGELLNLNLSSKKYKIVKCPVDKEIYSILTDDENGKWIGTAEGLFLNYKKDKWKKVSEIAKAYGIYRNKQDYWTIGRDAQNQSKLLYNEQFFLSIFFMLNISKQQWQQMIFNGLSSEYLKMNTLDFDSDGFIWVATDDGFIHYNPETGNGDQYSQSKYPEFKIKEVTNIVVVNKKKIWVTSKGRDIYKVDFK